jgi:hypothetical protein
MRIDQLHPTPTQAEPIEIPAQLLASVHRHQAHLGALVSSMRAAGIDGDAIEASVRTLVDSYANELTTAIRNLMQDERDV